MQPGSIYRLSAVMHGCILRIHENNPAPSIGLPSRSRRSSVAAPVQPAKAAFRRIAVVRARGAA